MNSIIKTIASLLIVLMTLVVSKTVLACSPMGSDNFFTLTFTPDLSTVPEGIQFQNYLNHGGHIARGGVYSIENKSAEPFYLITVNPDANKKYPDSQVPENYIPLGKVTNTTSFSYINNKWEHTFNPYIRIYGAYWDYFYIKDIKVPQQFGETRPANIEVPKPQKIKILGYFKNQIVTIEGTLSYTLKEDFNPNQSQKGVEACRQFNSSQW